MAIGDTTEIPELEIVEELDFYDRPILFTADILGARRLVFLEHETPDMRDVWLVSTPSADLLEKVCANRVPFREACTAGPFFRLTEKVPGGRLEACEISGWPEKALPYGGAMLVFEEI